MMPVPKLNQKKDKGKKMDSVKEWISTSEAVSMVQEKGIRTSANALYVNGLKDGFCRRAEDGIHWEYAQKGIADFIARCGAPEIGWISLKEATVKYKVKSIHNLYYAVRVGNIESKLFGRKKTIHVREKDMESYGSL